MIAIIISGGAGSRLWPVSRQSDPKPFIKLADGYSLLQNTFNRANGLPNMKKILTVTNEKIFFRMLEEYKKVNRSALECDFILEPFGRNTATAILSACLLLNRQNLNDEQVIVLPADHLVTNTAAFNQAVIDATQISDLGYLVTFGITPEYPEIGYGYIEKDAMHPLVNGYKIKRFVEKPSLDTANQYLSSGNYLWNSGMFLGKVSSFIEEFKLLSPALYNAVNKCFDKSIQSADTHMVQNGRVVHLNPELLRHIENVSIDYALFEKSKKTATIPCAVGWSDIGSWLSIAQTLPKDENANAIIGESVLYNTKNCLVYSTDRMIAGVDLRDLIIVDTPDALLVANKNSSQNVKHIFDKLKNSKHQTSELHQTVHKLWGRLTTVEDSDFYTIFRYEINSGATLLVEELEVLKRINGCEQSLSKWIVVAGSLELGGKHLVQNDIFNIDSANSGKIINQTDDLLVLLEIRLK